MNGGHIVFAYEVDPSDDTNECDMDPYIDQWLLTSYNEDANRLDVKDVLEHRECIYKKLRSITAQSDIGETPMKPKEDE